VYRCPITTELAESVLDAKPGLSHILGIDQLMDQYSVNTVLKLRNLEALDF